MRTDKLSASIHAVIEGSKGDKQRKAVESPDSLFSIAHARIVDLISEGEIEGFAHGADFLRDVYFDETPIQNEDGTKNFKNLQVDARTGTQNQSYIPGFAAVENELGVGVELKQNTPWTRSFTNKQLSAVRVRLGVQSLSAGDSETGDVKGTTVQYAMDIATDGGAFVEVMRSAMTGKSSGPYERGHRLELPKSTVSGWIIRVRRLTPDSATQYLNNKTSVVSCTEIIDGKFRYPMSAVVGIQVDSSQFPNIPTRAFHVKGRKIRVPANYNPVTRTYATTGTGTSGGAWDGTFKTVYSNNPAWVFYDMTTHRRYGLGKLVDELVIDKWSLYAIGQYCDETVPDGFGGTEPRMTCNLYLQKAADAWKVIGDLSSIFRGICYWAGGSVVPVADRPSDPVYTYTNANVVGGAFQYQSTGRRARHTAVIVSYNDMTDFCRLKSDYYDDPEGIARFGFQLAEINAMGCTSRGQAQRFAKWLLYTEKLLTNTVAFAVGPEGTYGAPGQIIRIADKHRAGRRIGGRISSATASNVVLDKLPEVAPMAGDTLIVTLPEGYTESRTVQSVVGNGINVSVPFTAIPVPESVWAIESSDLSTQLFRLLGTEKSDDGGYSMVAMQHNPSIFDAVDLGEAISVPPISVIPSPAQMRPVSVTVSSVERAGQVVTMPLLTATWPAATGAVKYQIQWQKDNGEWTAPQEIHGTTADLQTPFPGVYIAKVQALNAIGVTSVPQFSLPYTLADQSLKPGFVDQLNADIAAAMLEAENAAAAADGSIVSFWQDTMPVIGPGAGEAKEGDIWFDTNDGNRIWRAVGPAWEDAQDDDLALALAAASTAQGTADGKVKTWFGVVAPTAPDVTATVGIGDLWFNTTLKKLHRWNGSDWNMEIADVTLDQIGGNGVNLLDNKYSTFASLPDSGFTTATATLDSAVTKIDGAMKLAFPSTAGKLHYLGPLDGVIKLTAGNYIVSAWVACGLASRIVRFTMRGPDGTTTQHFGTNMTTSATAGQMLRLSCVVTVPTDGLYALAFDPPDEAIAINYWIDGVMVEAQVGRLNSPSAFDRGKLDAAVTGVIAAAAAAQDTADGKIQSFYQDGMPSNIAPDNASLGDIWFDTNDGNKQWRHNGSMFVEAQDTAIGDAITAAAGAQGTADGKVTTYYRSTAPTDANAPPAIGALKNGDLWVHTGDKNKLHRYNGSSWVLIRDSGVDDALDGLTGGGNLLPNADFAERNGDYPAGAGAAGMTPRSQGFSGEGASGYFNVPGVHVYVMNTAQGGAFTPGQYIDAKLSYSESHHCPVEPGKTYIGSVYAAAHRAEARGYLRFYDAAGALTSSNNLPPTVALGGVRLELYERIFIKAVAPANSVRAELWIRASHNANSTGTESYGAFARPMIEEVNAAQLKPSPWSMSSSGLNAKTLVAIANAAVAQSTADGKITLFRQSTAPTSGMSEGDIWIDTDDNSMWTRVGSTWSEAEDSKIGQALDAAFTAQDTADGKAATFYSYTAPTAEGVGDFWFNRHNGELKRWSGSAWESTVSQTTPANGANLLPNPSFTVDTLGLRALGARLTEGDGVIDGWYLRGVGGTGSYALATGGTIQGIRTYVANPTIPAGGAAYAQLRARERIPLDAGAKYVMMCEIQNVANGALNAGFTANARLIFECRDSDDVITGTFSKSVPRGSATGDPVEFTAPAGTRYAWAYFDTYVYNGSGASGVPNTNSVALYTNWRHVSLIRKVDLDTFIDDGPVYGRYAVDDRFWGGGKYRVGLRYPGSGHRIGDQRNLPQSNTTSYGSMRTATALSATSAGAVTVNAHTVRYGGISIAYSAVSNAITGLPVGATRVIYCFDDGYTGGVKTWYAGTDPAAVMNLGDGVVVAGQITIPSSGSGTGGGGGTGNPEDWCVDWDTVLPDGRYLRDLRTGDLVQCIDVRTGEVGMFPLLAMGFGEEECYRLVTKELHSIIQSKSTPMDLPNGQVRLTPDMFGRPVYATINGTPTLTIVADLEYLGLRRVLKPDFGDRMFFAGESADKCLATHNAMYKP